MTIKISDNYCKDCIQARRVHRWTCNKFLCKERKKSDRCVFESRGQKSEFERRSTAPGDNDTALEELLSWISWNWSEETDPEIKKALNEINMHIHTITKNHNREIQ